MLEARWTGPGEEAGDAFFIREEVFVKEQEFSLESEFDEIDPVAHHVVLYDKEGSPRACGRIFPDPEMGKGTWHVGRIAVMKPSRGTGVGREVMREIERKALEVGAARLVLGAQCRAQGFYESLGYSPYGEIFMDEYCEHIYMEKHLK